MWTMLLKRTDSFQKVIEIVESKIDTSSKLTVVEVALTTSGTEN